MTVIEKILSFIFPNRAPRDGHYEIEDEYEMGYLEEVQEKAADGTAAKKRQEA